MRQPSKLFALFLTPLLFPSSATAQPAPNPPRFEAATIKPAESPSQTLGGLPSGPPAGLFAMLGSVAPDTPVPMPDPGRVRIRNMNLAGLIALAYGVSSEQIRAPDWSREMYFSVESTVPPGTPKPQVRLMLRSLLEERFGLVVHREAKELPGYALIVGKNGPKLTPGAPPPPDPTRSEAEKIAAFQKQAERRAREFVAELGPSPHAGGFSGRHYRAITLARLAFILSLDLGSPVLDLTALEGTYDVTIATSTHPDAGDTIFDAVEKLGLKLVSKRVATELIVVGNLTKSPTPN